MGKEKELVLFGGKESWDAADWTASDDRVRGGKSQSHLDISKSSARFYGNLDIKTLGGAGFASQRTTSEEKTWNLSDYDGIQINLGKSDGKRYTFILKDELLSPKLENGREQATVSYEYDFTNPEDAAQAEHSFVFVPWKDFTPTYRGKEKKDAKALDRKNVKRFSIMMRSFFGDQEGDFSLTIKSIKAVSRPDDVEEGFLGEKSKTGNVEEDERSSSFTASSVISLLAACVIGYGICRYMCSWVENTISWRL
ncbi:CIA30-domain-containing protein [Lentithecium fluviatile CBS 122367]|uniref:CIA30-domain-containing protein n=1 Tax=Lentithecium fluviatile CBS 122367 TaxID=1168545 RepID=A0A6G1JL39_9PLEO|nr:CIA30-domain-containing protein [Lentithecium fluviatile CBS 122367]